jgi:outer membrane lipoprotein-sorting protein
MKKIILISLILILITGCGTPNGNDILKNLTNTINKADSYYLEGSMKIINNEDTYTYNVNVAYKKDNFYKVELTNNSNNHQQVILRNEDGVYVVTPNLNKSFKFQSDWPNNNSQVYLLDSIINDIEGDDDYTSEKTESGYMLTSKVNYPNNANLVKQALYLDSNLNIKEVQVLDTDNKVQIQMEFSKIDFNHKFDDNYFKLNQIISTKSDTSSDSTDSSNDSNTNTNTDSSSEDEETEDTVSIDNIIYPMYLPTNTYLTDKDTVNTDNGQRLILNFDGDNSFVLIEETSSYNDNNLVIPVSGDIDFVADVLAVVSDSSITWTNAGIDYYMASSDLEVSELLQIARSISALPVSK